MSLCIIPEKKKKKCNIPVFSFNIFFSPLNVSISFKLFFIPLRSKYVPDMEASVIIYLFIFFSSIFEIEKDTRKSYR